MSEQTFDIYHIPTIKKGDQLWNEDKTEGYEFVEPLSVGQMLVSDHVKPLGASPKPNPHEIIPEWFWRQVKSIATGGNTL